MKSLTILFITIFCSSCATVIQSSRVVANVGKTYTVAIPTDNYRSDGNKIYIEVEKYRVKDQFPWSGEDIHMPNFTRISKIKLCVIERASIPRSLSEIYPISEKEILAIKDFKHLEAKAFTVKNFWPTPPLKTNIRDCFPWIKEDEKEYSPRTLMKEHYRPYSSVIATHKTTKHYFTQVLYPPALALDIGATLAIVPVGLIAIPIRFITKPFRTPHKECSHDE